MNQSINQAINQSGKHINKYCGPPSTPHKQSLVSLPIYHIKMKSGILIRLEIFYRSTAEEREVNATYCQSLEKMLPELDYLVITCSLNKDSKHLVGKKQLDLMKPTAIIVNGGRGLFV